MDESFMDEIEFSDGERAAEQLACAMANQRPPCPRCGRCGFIEDQDMNLAGVCPECHGAGCMLDANDKLSHAAEQPKTL